MLEHSFRIVPAGLGGPDPSARPREIQPNQAFMGEIGPYSGRSNPRPPWRMNGGYCLISTDGPPRHLMRKVPDRSEAYGHRRLTDSRNRIISDADTQYSRLASGLLLHNATLGGLAIDVARIYRRCQVLLMEHLNELERHDIISRYNIDELRRIHLELAFQQAACEQTARPQTRTLARSAVFEPPSKMACWRPATGCPKLPPALSIARSCFSGAYRQEFLLLSINLDVAGIAKVSSMCGNVPS
jgi:hypothetical protein